MPFDGSTIATATTATLFNFSYSDTFSIISTGDVDMVAISLLAGRNYTIDIDNGAAGDLYLRVFDAFGSEVRANDDGFRLDDDVVFSLSPYVEFTPNYAGTYYVAVSTYFLQGYDPFTTFGRSLSVENPIGIVSGTLSISDEGFNNWPFEGSITAITTEGSSDETDAFRDEGRSHRVQYFGNLEDSVDVDMARMDLFKGDVVVVDVNGLNGLSTTIRVFNAVGTQIGFDDLAGFASDPELVFGAPSAGSHYIGISGDGNIIYNAMDGTGTIASAFTGDFEVIVHLNPTMIGTNSFQLLNSLAESDYIVALAGDDTVNGNDGNDTLAGGDDQDSMSGGRGLDVLYGEHGNDTLRGDGGRDVLVGGLGDDLLDGGADTDSLDGGAGNDSLLGGVGGFADTLSGGEGSDTLSGGGGNDSLIGSNGDDSLLGDAQEDQLFGGSGLDILRGGAGNDTLDGGFDADQLFGDNGDDRLIGFQGNDTLNGGEGSDSLLGDFGSDSLLGDGGNDTLEGGADGDVLNGGDNQDRLSGGAASDTLVGGAGSDVFVFLTGETGTDRIEDMTLLLDRIDLSSIFAATGSVVTGANLSEFVQVTPAGAGADTFLAVDANGLTGGSAFTTVALVIGIAPVALFNADNFIL